eukprot:TRINITY_DN54549_c0_g1_i1.p1 TRINITY_DN54549_c0_g1~~TRINITY_DN54549_c0_g1_i1.p1  ORF type:complete len:118 (+),score=6.27 TRINITY_DN54549_c0_g1_i1:355-708(+)
MLSPAALPFPIPLFSAFMALTFWRPSITFPCARSSSARYSLLLTSLYPSLSGDRSTVRIQPVSYTHLRAHETPEHLVCRLLLEKKKKEKRRNIVRSRVQRRRATNVKKYKRSENDVQ